MSKKIKNLKREKRMQINKSAEEFKKVVADVVRKNKIVTDPSATLDPNELNRKRKIKSLEKDLEDLNKKLEEFNKFSEIEKKIKRVEDDAIKEDREHHKKVSERAINKTRKKTLLAMGAVVFMVYAAVATAIDEDTVDAVLSSTDYGDGVSEDQAQSINDVASKYYDQNIEEGDEVI